MLKLTAVLYSEDIKTGLYERTTDYYYVVCNGARWKNFAPDQRNAIKQEAEAPDLRRGGSIDLLPLHACAHQDWPG
jgi:hypothetical protein